MDTNQVKSALMKGNLVRIRVEWRDCRI